MREEGKDEEEEEGEEEAWWWRGREGKGWVSRAVR